MSRVQFSPACTPFCYIFKIKHTFSVEQIIGQKAAVLDKNVPKFVVYQNLTFLAE
jgi:hypothetical protein